MPVGEGRQAPEALVLKDLPGPLQQRQCGGPRERTVLLVGLGQQSDIRPLIPELERLGGRSTPVHQFPLCPVAGDQARYLCPGEASRADQITAHQTLLPAIESPVREPAQDTSDRGVGFRS